MRYALLIFTAIAFMACTKEDTTGMFSFGIANDADISIVEQTQTEEQPGGENTSAQTRADGEFNVDDFTVVVTQDGGGTVVNSKYAAVKEQKYYIVDIGSYTAMAESCTEEVSESANNQYGQLRLYGTTTFSVSAGMATDVNLNCSITNSKVSVTAGGEFSSVYDTARSKIILSSDPDGYNRALEFSGTDSKNAYYPSGSNVYIKIECYKIGESTKETFNIATPITTQAATWHKLTINATLANAPAEGTGITVDVNSVKLTVNNGIGINPYNPGNGVAEDE